MRTFQSTFIKSSKTQSSHSRYSNGRGSLFSLTPIVYLLRSRIRNPHREMRQNTMANSTMKEFSNWKCVMVRPFIRTHDLLQPTLSNELVLPQSLTSKIPSDSVLKRWKLPLQIYDKGSMLFITAQQSAGSPCGPGAGSRCGLACPSPSLELDRVLLPGGWAWTWLLELRCPCSAAWT